MKTSVMSRARPGMQKAEGGEAATAQDATTAYEAEARWTQRSDFMFQLTKQEFDDLRSQLVTSSWGGRRYPPYAPLVVDYYM